MSTDGKREWYKHGWGLFAAIIFLPLFAIWYAWAKSNWSKNVKIGTSLVAIAAVVVAGIASNNNTSKTPPAPLASYTVSEFVDGDTLKVKASDGHVDTVRLIGIDTPETKDPRTTVQCFGVEASQHIKDLIKDKKITLEADASQDNKDKYSRFLRYIKLEDGTDINLKMVADGFAYEYTYDKPYKNQSTYKKAQQEADAADKGLWSPNTCNGQKDKAAQTTTPPSTPVPTPTPTPTPEPTPQPSNCNPNYEPCVPNSSTDLDCPDIGFKVHVIGTDVYKLDRDHDGYGCESY